MVEDGLIDTFGAGHMVDFTYGMTLECDLAGSQWIGWKSGFLCGLWSHCCSVCHFGWYQDGNGDMICVVF